MQIEDKVMGRVSNALIRTGKWSEGYGATGGNRRPGAAPAALPARPIRFPVRPRRHGDQQPEQTADHVECPAPAAAVPTTSPQTVGTDLTPGAAFTPGINTHNDTPQNHRSVFVGSQHQAPVAIPYDYKALRLSGPRVDPRITVLTGRDHEAIDRCQALAVRLFNLASKRGLRTILVTSAFEGEGKTTVASNLAVLMARSSDRRVLLIDGDGRRPSVAAAFGIVPRQGWSALLAGTADPGQAVFRLDPCGLYICADSRRISQGVGPGGRPPKQDEFSQAGLGAGAADALASSRPEDVIRELEQSFQLIVIDSPPILQFAEAQRLAAIADGTVLVVSASRTNHQAVADALKLVPKDRRIGIVLNQSDEQAEPSYYKSKRGGA
jgi:protein-tyrosine kinase